MCISVCEKIGDGLCVSVNLLSLEHVPYEVK